MQKQFSFYLQKGLARRTRPNIDIAHHLAEKGKKRLQRIANRTIIEADSAFIFEEVYECLREVAQSQMELAGFKPYSHEALLAFLKEQNLVSEWTLKRLDVYRILRNESIYKAKSVSVVTCQEAIVFAQQFVKEFCN